MRHFAAEPPFVSGAGHQRRAEHWDRPEVVIDAFSPATLIASRRLIAATVILFLCLAMAYLTARPTIFISRAAIVAGAAASGPAGQRDLVAAESELRTQLDNKTRLTARLARIKSELGGKETVTFPPALAASREPAMAEIIENERLLHQTRQTDLRSKLTSLQQLLDFTRREIGSLAEQLRYATEQQQSIDKELETVRALAQKGLAPASRVSDLERTAATFGARRIEVETRLLQRQQDIFTAQQRIADTSNGVRNALLLELQETTASLEASDNRIRSLTGARQSVPVDSAGIANFIELMMSDATAREIATRLDLHSRPDFYAPPSLLSGLPGFSGKSPPEPGTPEAVSAAAAKIQGSLLVARVGMGSRLDITYQSDDPDLARRVVATLGTYFTAPAPSLAEGDAAGGAAQIVRGASLSRAGPPAVGVMLAALLAGLGVGGGLAILIRYSRLVSTAPRRTVAPA
ncbi:hypothetical protein [Terrihabitans rhizophilus]|uniref:AprE-like long alpha-helical hairpin domain-containing protein n=1 Tax=Terrihabitans rhizophilus TaxID=3092662 RepID=A0ABU4RMP3_9HYPH|nr:hypothetical protein [Terrihabitans sp. PJ23]MDX6805000.1 hypothetical protein [Terrihabitans sp. PJ23]